MSESDAETVVVVESPDAPEPPPEDDAPDVVVVDTGDDGASDGELDIARTVGELVARVEALERQTTETEYVAEAAQDTADAAIDIAIDAEQEAVIAETVAVEAEESAEQAEPEPDQPPSGKHPFFKSWHELRTGGS